MVTLFLPRALPGRLAIQYCNTVPHFSSLVRYTWVSREKTIADKDKDAYVLGEQFLCSCIPGCRRTVLL